MEGVGLIQMGSSRRIQSRLQIERMTGTVILAEERHRLTVPHAKAGLVFPAVMLEVRVQERVQRAQDRRQHAPPEAVRCKKPTIARNGHAIILIGACFYYLKVLVRFGEFSLGR